MSDRVVAVFAPMYPPAFRGGGPIRSLHTIVTTAPEDFEPVVVTRDRDLGADGALAVTANAWVSSYDSTVMYASAGSLRRLFAAMRSVRRRNPKLLYFNSFFDPALSIVPQLLGLLGWWRGGQRVVAVRGEFGTAALNLKTTKKRLYIAAYKLLRLDRKVIWHATSPDEAAAIRRVMGDGVRMVVRSDEGSPLVVDPQSLHCRDGRLRVLFLGRIVPIKGLEDALVSLGRAQGSIQLDVVGPLEDESYVARCRAAAAELPPNVSVAFKGAVDGEQVSAVLAEHDVLVMPTHGENFGHVIGEALAAGVPVLVRDVTPWTPYIEAGGGIVVAGADGWSAAIDRFAAMPPEERLARRRAAVAAYRAWQDDLEPGHLFEDLALAAGI